MPRISVGFFLFYLFKAFIVNGQADVPAFETKIKAKPSHTIWVNGGQLIRQELQIGYERSLTNQLSLECAAGYKKSRRDGINYNVHLSRLIKNLNTSDYAERMPFSEGILVSAALKYFTDPDQHKRSRVYFSPQLFYRYRYYDQQLVTTFAPSQDNRRSRASLQSLDLNIYGGKILVGNTITLFGLGKTKKVLLDVYYGFGLRHKNAKTTYFWSGLPYYAPPATLTNPPEVEKISDTFLSQQLGLKLGFQF